MQQLVPSGAAFFGNSSESLRYRELQRSFAAILKGILPVGGYSISEITSDLDSIAYARLNALEVDAENQMWVEGQH